MKKLADKISKLPDPPPPGDVLLHQHGRQLSDTELVSVLLGPPYEAARVRAAALLNGCGGLGGLGGLSAAEAVRSGLSRPSAARLLGAVELGRRLARARIPQRRPLDRPDLVADYLMLRYGRQGQEVMGALFLDCRGRLIGDAELYRGTLHRTPVEPRLVLKEALVRDAAAFVLFHTHPSGDPAPSAEDLLFTRRVADAGELLGVRLSDHLILGSAGRWVSLRRRGKW